MFLLGRIVWNVCLGIMKIQQSLETQHSRHASICCGSSVTVGFLPAIGAPLHFLSFSRIRGLSKCQVAADPDRWVGQKPGQTSRGSPMGPDRRYLLMSSGHLEYTAMQEDSADDHADCQPDRVPRQLPHPCRQPSVAATPCPPCSQPSGQPDLRGGEEGQVVPSSCV